MLDDPGEELAMRGVRPVLDVLEEVFRILEALPRAARVPRSEHPFRVDPGRVLQEGVVDVV